MRYETKGLHPVSKRPYKLYIVTEDVDRVLQEWNEYKKTHPFTKSEAEVPPEN
jgi:hypothetical protein